MNFFSFHVRKSFIIAVGSFLVILFAICLFGSLLYELPLTVTKEYEEMVREKLAAAFEFRQNYYEWRGTQYILEGNFTAANAAFNLAIAYNPNNASAYLSRGMLKSQRGQYYRAISDFDRALECNLEYEDEEILDYQKATLYFERARARISLKPNIRKNDRDKSLVVNDLVVAAVYARVAGMENLLTQIDKLNNYLDKGQ